MAGSAQFQASLLMSAQGLAGGIFPVVVRSGFGSGTWVSVVASDTSEAAARVSQFRTFHSGPTSMRFRDLQADLAVTELVGPLVYLGVNDCSAVIIAALYAAETSDSASGFLVRAEVLGGPGPLTIGCAPCYSKLGVSRLPVCSPLQSLLTANSHLSAQVVENTLRLGLATCPDAHPLNILRASAISALLVSGLDHLGRHVVHYKGPLGSTEDFGCAARLLPLIWASTKLGLTHAWEKLANSTTREGYVLLDWLENVTSRSPDAWARDMRALSRAAPGDTEAVLPPLNVLLKVDFVPEAFLDHLGEVYKDLYASICLWLEESRLVDLKRSEDIVEVFSTNSGAKSPTQELGAFYLGAADPRAGNITHALLAVMSPRTKKLDEQIWFSVLSHHALTLNHEGFFPKTGLE